jgi:FlaA1/EpsC-like NDP-sugar epimerase
VSRPRVRTTVIVGAGFAGAALAREIVQKMPDRRLEAFWDDDPAKIGTTVEGIPVRGPVAEAARQGADEALIAIPSATKNQLKTIWAALVDAGIPKIRILPALSQIVDGEAHLVLTREIDPQDLLGRNPVQISLKESLKYLHGKRVMITGAGGSIGSELARQLLSGGAERLYLYGHGENSIYQIDKELRLLQAGGVGVGSTIVPVIGDLKDANHLEFLLSRMNLDVIFHTAAHKHVPMVELNPVEAVTNNVFGTHHLVEAALAAGVSRFVLISTDKAVEPNSVYGATKRICEDLVLEANTRAGDGRFLVVRFGNVLGSRGSILPLFQDQIQAGGPITITDNGPGGPRMTRYFMTIPEAVSLVLQAGGVGTGGQLYLLDMGEPLVVEDLAAQVIRFHGKEPGKDIAFRYVGPRPGERFEEALWAPDEEPVPTAYTRLNRVVRPSPARDLRPFLKMLWPVCYFDPEQPGRYRNRQHLRTVLRAWVPTLEDKNEPEY